MINDINDMGFRMFRVPDFKFTMLLSIFTTPFVQYSNTPK